jgi:hypothetical protein
MTHRIHTVIGELALAEGRPQLRFNLDHWTPTNRTLEVAPALVLLASLGFPGDARCNRLANTLRQILSEFTGSFGIL